MAWKKIISKQEKLGEITCDSYQHVTPGSMHQILTNYQWRSTIFQYLWPIFFNPHNKFLFLETSSGSFIVSGVSKNVAFKTDNLSEISIVTKFWVPMLPTMPIPMPLVFNFPQYRVWNFIYEYFLKKSSKYRIFVSNNVIFIASMCIAYFQELLIKHVKSLEFPTFFLFLIFSLRRNNITTS